MTCYASKGLRAVVVDPTGYVHPVACMIGGVIGRRTDGDGTHARLAKRALAGPIETTPLTDREPGLVRNAVQARQDRPWQRHKEKEHQGGHL
jgi:hypothetical protein